MPTCNSLSLSLLPFSPLCLRLTFGAFSPCPFQHFLLLTQNTHKVVLRAPLHSQSKCCSQIKFIFLNVPHSFTHSLSSPLVPISFVPPLYLIPSRICFNKKSRKPVTKFLSATAIILLNYSNLNHTKNWIYIHAKTFHFIIWLAQFPQSMALRGCECVCRFGIRVFKCLALKQSEVCFILSIC